MEFCESKLVKNCYEIYPKIFEDERGRFCESFNWNKFNEVIGDFEIKQFNTLESQKGVLRGLHLQKGMWCQEIIVSVSKGCGMHVAVDCRTNSPTFGNVTRFILSDTEQNQVFVPNGCAHGFVSFEHGTIVTYLCNQYYNKDQESGLLWCDPQLNIDWILPKEQLIVSKKDNELPYWSDSYKFENE